jgi:hypothetical protein
VAGWKISGARRFWGVLGCHFQERWEGTYCDDECVGGRRWLYERRQV